jgi:hypothetical protein
MAGSTNPKVEFIAHELALLRDLAADRRQASWLATLQRRRIKAKPVSKLAKATAAVADEVRRW